MASRFVLWYFSRGRDLTWLSAAVQQGGRSPSLPASSSPHVDLRCGAAHDRPDARYTCVGDSGGVEGNRWEQTEHCRGFVWDAQGSPYYAIQLHVRSMVAL